MKKVITMLLSILVLSSCVSSNGYYQITGYDTVGIIKDYDKNDKVDILAEKMLKKQLPNMKGEAAFVDVEILGEENGKTYVLASYACYEKSGEGIKLVYGDQELAELNDVDDSDYNSISGQEVPLRVHEFLPQSIIGKMELDKGTGNFSWYVYTIGKVNGELQLEAEEYFSKK